jgi:putative flavoprotein involved in K+ transport
VLDRVRHVAQIRLGRVVHEGGEHVLGVAAALLDELGDDHGVLGDRVEDAAVAAEAALVGERAGDVAGVELLRIGVERVDPAARDRLQVRAGSGRGAIGHGHVPECIRALAARVGGAMVDDSGTIVIGAGQAGLAVSCRLTELGVAHVVLERGRVGETWRGRWDSFCLVTPNWTVQLPSRPYDGDDPDGFMARDEVVAYLERYAAACAAPVREGVGVTSLRREPDGGFLLETPAGPLRARTVVLAAGAYQRPHRPAAAANLPASVQQIDVEGYTNPAALAPGAVLVVGSGQSGCQIAEELHEAGRDVFLACGRAPWAPRRFGDRDLLWWALETGFLDAAASSLPDPSARLLGNILATGHGGGHDLHLRTLRRLGVTLLGHFLGADGHVARFADDLADSVAWGDQRHAEFMGLVRRLVAERGLPEPEIPEPEPFGDGAPEQLDLRGLGAVVFTTGFRPDFASWVDCPGAFDALGFPVHVDGASTAAEGLYFAGTHFLRKRKSSLLVGVGEDATIVARAIAARSAGAGRR